MSLSKPPLFVFLAGAAGIFVYFKRKPSRSDSRIRNRENIDSKDAVHKKCRRMSQVLKEHCDNQDQEYVRPRCNEIPYNLSMKKISEPHLKEAEDVNSMQNLEIEVEEMTPSSIEILESFTMNEEELLEANYEERLIEKELLELETLVARNELKDCEADFLQIILAYEKEKAIQVNLEQNEITLRARASVLETVLENRNKKYEHIKALGEKLRESMKQEFEEQDKKTNAQERENFGLRGTLSRAQKKMEKLQKDVVKIVAEYDGVGRLCSALIEKC